MVNIKHSVFYILSKSSELENINLAKLKKAIEYIGQFSRKIYMLKRIKDNKMLFGFIYGNELTNE